MSKVTLNNITGGYAAVDLLNENFDAIEAAFENTLSRNGAVPNTWLANQDANHKRLLNLADPIDDKDAANKEYVINAVVDATPIAFAKAAYYVDRFTGDGSDTTFTLTAAPGLGTNSQVYINGAYQNKNTYNINSTTLTFTEAPPNNSDIEVVVVQPVAAEVNAASNITIADAGNYYTSANVEGALQEAAQFRETIRTSDYANFNDALTAATGKTLIVNSTISISANTTVASTVFMRIENEGLFNIATGITFTINGPFDAGIYQIFNCIGTGKVVFNSSFTEFGYPEWWGAITGDGSTSVATANLAAINAAIIALPIIKFQRADYFVSNTVQVRTSHVRLEGQSVRYGGTNMCTRIIVTSGTADTMFVGLTSNPGSINDFAQQIYISHIEVTRSQTIVPPASGYEINGCAGIRLQFALYVYMEHVKASEHTMGFVYNGVVQVHQKLCESFRSASGATTVNDFFWGWYINGYANIGLAGGNGSIYFTDCGSSVGGAPALSSSCGFFMNGGYADTFLQRFETAYMDIGIQASGLITSSNATLKKTGNVDLHIISPVIDQFKQNGLVLYAGSDYANITVIDGYYAPNSAASSGSCIEIRDSGGTVNLQGNQCICWGVSGTKGIYIKNANGVMSDGNMILGALNPIVMDQAYHCRITDIINSPNEIGNAAVSMTSSSRNYVAPVVCASVIGGTVRAYAFAQGVNMVSTGNTYNEINCTGIDPLVINTGSGNKLVYNSTQITSTGTFGTNNLASGIIG